MKNLQGTLAFAFEGALLQCEDKATGEVHILPLPPGPIDLTPYQPLVADFEVRADNVFVYRTASGRARDVRTHMHTLTSADQEFQPSLQRLQEREMKRMAMRIAEELDRKRQLNQKREQQAREKAQHKRVAETKTEQEAAGKNEQKPDQNPEPTETVVEDT